ncbi:phosphoesterase [Prevotella lacticifex]|uniref:Phosphoesterase n=2 Tax=Prevotella lacticifex TaxID=2854755 RepID=A0A9R1CZS0_9BACT|nr:metallophosphoesterase [Prevotella lacticifex]GJG35026.1 phosphoesterase [Prevotella lacticifex]GJG39923.1 phosphoesterase [Prevotella lacticifex]GJG41395.1 phosphoesterase [Prevotella lacticifex]GJG46276.1 phosphoesterase [Prevotella lacticifex]GJG47747.1 phosphoesterase [Prevotella lacticifex]
MARNMIFFAVLFVVLLVAPDVYIATEYINPSASGIVKVLWWLPTVLTLTCFVLANREIMHNTSMRLFFALVLCVALPKLLFVILQFVFSPVVALVTALVPVALFAYGFFFGWRRIVVRKAVCESELLPQSFDGYRILQLSDLHIGTFLKNKSFIRKLVNVVNEQHADLIVFTGDLVNVRADEVRPFVSDLSKMVSKDGVLSVMGNHDYCEYGQDHSEEYKKRNQNVLHYFERKMGWRLLDNEHVTIGRLRQANGENISESIAIIGVENISKPPFPDYGNLAVAMGELPKGMFKVLLSHDPSHWRRGVLHKTDIALTLSGHTHAGQLKIGKFSPSKWAYNEWGGKYTEGNSMLYVSTGVGGTVPFRFGAWPEINIITLKRKG